MKKNRYGFLHYTLICVWLKEKNILKIQYLFQIGTFLINLHLEKPVGKMPAYKPEQGILS